MSKFFVVDPKPNFHSNEEMGKRHIEFVESVNDNWKQREEKASLAISNYIPLKAPKGRIIVVVNLEYKNYAKLNDTTIRLERQFNNLNRRETEPVNAFVINAQHIPQGAEVLVHHNSLHDTNRIFGAEKLCSGDVSADVKYYSIKENECFLWRKDSSEWNPCTVFETALRVFKPYNGLLENIPHTKIKDTLYVTSGKLKGKVVATLKGCDYEIIFNDIDGKESRVIRFRPFGEEENSREEEAICVLKDLTEKVKSGEYFVGLSDKDCKSIKNTSNEIKNN